MISDSVMKIANNLSGYFTWEQRAEMREYLDSTSAMKSGKYALWLKTKRVAANFGLDHDRAAAVSLAWSIYEL